MRYGYLLPSLFAASALLPDFVEAQLDVCAKGHCDFVSADSTCECCNGQKSVVCEDYFSRSIPNDDGRLCDAVAEPRGTMEAFLGSIDGYEFEADYNCGWDPIVPFQTNNAGKFVCNGCTNVHGGYEIKKGGSIDECKQLCDAESYDTCAGFAFFQPYVPGANCLDHGGLDDSIGSCYFRRSTIIDEGMGKPGAGCYRRLDLNAGEEIGSFAGLMLWLLRLLSGLFSFF